MLSVALSLEVDEGLESRISGRILYSVENVMSIVSVRALTGFASHESTLSRGGNACHSFNTHASTLSPYHITS